MNGKPGENNSEVYVYENTEGYMEPRSLPYSQNTEYITYTEQLRHLIMYLV